MYSIPDPARLDALLRAPALADLGDDDLLAYVRSLGTVMRRVDAASAAAAAEIARRSGRDLGYSGLAQRLGARSPEVLVQQTLGTSRREAHDLVAVGGLLESAHAAEWTGAVREGALSVAAAAVIDAGLGTATEALPQAVLDRAAADLVAASPALTVEQLAARAREIRDDLDADGVQDREAALRDRRFLRLTLLSDGMTRLLGLLDPESAAMVAGVIDAATSPRRGGPRFTTPGESARADAVVADPRSTEQIACDALVHLLTAGAHVDPDRMLLGRVAPVQVVATASDVSSGSGYARIDGQSASASIATARRIACTAGSETLRIDSDGQPLNLGRTRRLFTPAQRRAIATRDGGCLFCDRPPSWCEAHHITEWSRDGLTDVADGVLLCRFHHLMVLNNA